jgi:hypothetical protein
MSTPIVLEPSQIKKCKFCGADIAWLQNAKGKYYPVNADLAMDHQAATYKTNFHRCTQRGAQ